jgi:(4-(4-[2-(gamma-L-glutamylamino)ethyl]phenoxymethyl)furan-2-yl)methanamine synthase
MQRQVLGLDIGGANIKAATADGSFTETRYFPMWNQSYQLAEVLRDIVKHVGANFLAVTMTGELADCFESKQHGVEFICDAVIKASTSPDNIYVYRIDGDWLAPAQCTEQWSSVTASNWHAIASIAAASDPQQANILLDIGSTTVDIIPLNAGVSVPNNLTDVDRLQSHQLLYWGIQRTPICALIDTAELDDRQIPIARELFATTQDIFLMTGDIGEDIACHDTTDGKPATRQYAHARLARSVCECPTQFSSADAINLGQQIKARLVSLLDDALSHVIQGMEFPPQQIILTGHGNFLTDCISPQLPILNLFTSERSRVAPAYAVAILLEKYLDAIN